MADKADIDAHVAVLERIMELYVERDELHDALWKEYGAADNILHVRSKFLRMESLAKRGRFENALIEAEDLINYALFFIRNVQEGRL